MEKSLIESFLQPWYKSLNDPAQTQERVLQGLIEGYRKTRYGRDHGASEVSNLKDFRERFPLITYQGLKPYLDEVLKGNFEALLPEQPSAWVMTRGSTGQPKLIPATKTHLEQIFECGARAFLNYIIKRKDFQLLQGGVLNLNFPSVVGTLIIKGQSFPYGYSSGTYAKLNPLLSLAKLIPEQEKIDALPPTLAKEGWEKRFELAYQEAKEKNMVTAMGVTPVITSFGRYIKKRHGVWPKDLWRMRALFCTSVAKIHIKYAPRLRALYGKVPVIEMYSATEGVFAQQLNDDPYVSPNYDAYLLEVETGRGIKMLYEMGRGEWGRLIISSCLFPRYDIGDMIECAGKNYFRVFGRAKLRTTLEHKAWRLLARFFS